jgi:hypothetical protein
MVIATSQDVIQLNARVLTALDDLAGNICLAGMITI